jgi:LuxR family maltose regulon positive regulatory protein
MPGGPLEAPIDELMNGIAALGAPFVVVLDDAHSVTDAESLASIGYALEHLPPTARIVLLTRVDPVLPLARLRGRGDLVELRAHELAFTLPEARELLLDRAGLRLAEDELELLHARTEGWPAALSLAALWLRGVDDTSRAVRAFGGDHRFVADFLTEEVLGTLTDELLSFLLRASVLGRLTADLCDAVLERADSASVLAELERSNLFVARLEHGGWYRVHPLVAEYAGFQLASREPAAPAEIHRRAAEWLRACGLPTEAVEHAAAAGDHELVAELLVEHHLALIRSGRARTLVRWARALPEVYVMRRPELAVAAATAATMIGRQAVERRRLLQLADRARERHPDSVSPYAEAVGAMVRAAAVDGDVAEAVEDGRRAVELARAGADEVLVAALAAHARALYLAGDLAAAGKAALGAVEHPDAEARGPGHAFARSTLALVAAERGRLAPARAHADAAKAIVGTAGTSRSWLGAQASAALGAVLAGEGRLADAERELSVAERFFEDQVASIHHAWVLVLLTRVRCRRGRLDEAGATLRRALGELGELSDAGRVGALAAEAQAELQELQARAGGGELVDGPTEADLAVLLRLDSDLTSRQIAVELFLSPNTVRSHIKALYRKLGVGSRADAVARARALGLVGQPRSPG